MSKYLPYCSAKSIYSINLDFFKRIGVKFLLLDLDNTLDSPHTPIPSKETIDLIEKIKKSGLIPIIVSNNKQKRVSLYSNKLNVTFISRAFKPFPFRVKKYLKDEKISMNSVIIIGDQVFTDIFCANNLGIKSILTDRLSDKDQFVTLINRKIDQHYRKKIIKKGLHKNWEEIYANL